MSKSEMIRTEQLIRNYAKPGMSEKGENAIRVLKGLDFTVMEQEFIAIMGKSGCGKTTLLKILGLIDRPTSGKVYFKGKNTAKLWKDELADIRRRGIGFVFQDFYLLNSLSVLENIMLPMIIDKQDSKDCMEKGERYAAHFELTHLLKKYPYELSGGEKQRVAISRALINDPDLILADEPTGNLDTKSGRIVIKALERINTRMGKTVILVTHDPKIASYCRRILFLKDGKLLESLERTGTKEEFYESILEKMKEL